MDTLKSEPLVLGTIAKLVVLVAARWGLHWDATQLVGLFVGLEALITPLVRQKVTPVDKPILPAVGD